MADAGDDRISLRAFYALDTLRAKVGMERACQLTFGVRAQEVLDAIKVDSVAGKGR